MIMGLAIACAMGVTSNAWGQPVQPGFDLWTTPPGGAVEEFGGPDIPPIPADFFAPGSDPFVGTVEFQGVPIGGPAGPADTIVERLQPAPLGGPGTEAMIQIELVELSLVSTEPIVVTQNGGQNPQEWMVEATLGGLPSVGQMTIRQDSPEGGTYDATINVCGLLRFSLVQNPTIVRFLDICKQVSPGGQPISVSGQPWCYDIRQPPVSPLSGPNFVVKGPTIHTGPHPEAQPIESPAGPAIPTVSEWGLIVMGLLLLVAGTLVIRRVYSRELAAQQT
jgi:hypothetical protein